MFRQPAESSRGDSTSVLEALLATLTSAGKPGCVESFLEVMERLTGASWIAIHSATPRAGETDPAPLAERGTREEGIPLEIVPLESGGESGSLSLQFGKGRPAGLDAVLKPAVPLASLLLAGRIRSDRLARQELLVRCSEEMIRRVGERTGEDDLLHFFASLVSDAFPVDRVVILTATDDRKWVVRRAVVDRRADAPAVEWVPVSAVEISERPAPFGADRLVELDDMSDPSLPAAWREPAIAARVRGCIAAPITDTTGVTGFVLLLNERPGRALSAEESRLFGTLVRQISPILQNERMMRSLSRGLSSLEVLLETSREISSVLDLAEVPRLVARRAMELTEADEGVVFLLDHATGKLRPVLALSPFEAEIMRIEIGLGEGVTGSVGRTRIGEYVNRVDLDPRSKYIPGTPTVPEALLAAPLVCADRLIGVMSLYKLEGRTFTDLDLATINIFATQASIAIENARLFRRMEEERTRLAIMLEQMEESVFLCDADGIVRLINPAAERLLADEGMVGGRPLLEVFPDSLRTELAAILDDLKTAHGRHRTVEFTLRGRVHLASFTAIRDEKETLLGLMSLWKDITEMKTIETQLLQSGKMSAVGQLASGVAHEFNNLIAAIYGYAQFMKDNRDEKLFDKGIRIILSSSERARDLTRSLLTFSKASEGRIETIDVNELIGDALLLVEQQLIKEGIRIERSLGRLPHAVAERSRLQEALLNLISNARHAMPEGGVLTIRSRAEGAVVIVEVSDTGIGIPTENLSRIFEPFFTTKGPLNGNRIPGTGLGLFTVYNAVQAHGGRTEVESVPGRGTTIRLVFPEGLHAAPGPSAGPARAA